MRLDNSEDRGVPVLGDLQEGDNSKGTVISVENMDTRLSSVRIESHKFERLSQYIRKTVLKHWRLLTKTKGR